MDEKHKERLLDFSSLHKMSEGDTFFYSSMLVVFKNGCKEAITKIDRSAQKMKFTEIADSAHKLCSSFLHLGTLEVYQDLKHMEQLCRSSQKENNKNSIMITWKRLKQNLISCVEEIDEELASIKNN